MKKWMLLTVLLFLAAATLRVQAQSLQNTQWKMFIGDPMNDSVTLRIRADTSWVTTRAGDTVVRSVCLVSGDTLTLRDISGVYACPNMDGKYKIGYKGAHLVLALISDPCDGRVQSINGAEWVQAWK